MAVLFWSRFEQICPWIKLDQIGSNWIKKDKIDRAGVNILPNKWIRHPGTITDFLGLWVELLLARSADSNSAQRPKIRFLCNDVTTTNSTQKFLTKLFLCAELIEFGKKKSS